MGALRVGEFIPSTVIRATWAIMCSQYKNTPDVVFGTISMGSKAPIAGIERLAGYYVSTSPSSGVLTQG